MHNKNSNLTEATSILYSRPTTDPTACPFYLYLGLRPIRGTIPPLQALQAGTVGTQIEMLIHVVTRIINPKLYEVKIN